MDDVVLLEVRETVAVLTFNRPDRLNAWTPEMQTRYFDLLEECAAEPGVRAIVVTGAGRGFCAGADMQDLQTLAGDAIGRQRRRPRRPTSGPCPFRCRSRSRSSPRSTAPVPASGWCWR